VSVLGLVKGALRAEWARPNERRFATLAEAQASLDAWVEEYNRVLQAPGSLAANACHSATRRGNPGSRSTSGWVVSLWRGLTSRRCRC
jgi:hypothetical protein